MSSRIAKELLERINNIEIVKLLALNEFILKKKGMKCLKKYLKLKILI